MAWTNPFSRVRVKAETPVRVESRPLMAIYGWVGDVSKSDAISYAKGLAVSNATNPDNTRVYAIEFEGGYAYEVQEGGLGKPYLPSILEALASQQKGEFVYLSTARRLVRIDRDIQGVSSVWMPESENEPTSDTVTPHETAAMVLAVPDAANWVKFGSITLVLGVITAVIPVIAFSVALPILFSSGAEEVEQMSSVPLDRWPAILSAAGRGEQVKALELVNGRLEVRTTTLGAHAVAVPDTTPQSAQEALEQLPVTQGGQLQGATQ